MKCKCSFCLISLTRASRQVRKLKFLKYKGTTKAKGSSESYLTNFLPQMESLFKFPPLLQNTWKHRHKGQKFIKQIRNFKSENPKKINCITYRGISKLNFSIQWKTNYLAQKRTWFQVSCWQTLSLKYRHIIGIDQKNIECFRGYDFFTTQEA